MWKLSHWSLFSLAHPTIAWQVPLVLGLSSSTQRLEHKRLALDQMQERWIGEL